MSFSAYYLAEAAEIVRRLDVAAIERLAGLLAAVRARSGRLFVLGVGGGAGHASHAVNDFRKMGIAAVEGNPPWKSLDRREYWWCRRGDRGVHDLRPRRTSNDDAREMGPYRRSKLYSRSI